MTEASTIIQVEAVCEQSELRERARNLAVALLADGLETNEDRQHWKVDVRNDAREVVLTMTLSEAATGGDPRQLN